MTTPLLPDNRKTEFPTEDDELMGKEDEHLHIHPSNKLPGCYQSVKKVVEEKQWKVFWWEGKTQEIFVDAFTASRLVSIHDQISPESQTQMEKMIALGPNNFTKVVEISWKQE
jgi:hypothetical protein